MSAPQQPERYTGGKCNKCDCAMFFAEPGSAKSYVCICEHTINYHLPATAPMAPYSQQQQGAMFGAGPYQYPPHPLHGCCQHQMPHQYMAPGEQHDSGHQHASASSQQMPANTNQHHHQPSTTYGDDTHMRDTSPTYDRGFERPTSHAPQKRPLLLLPPPPQPTPRDRLTTHTWNRMGPIDSPFKRLRTVSPDNEAGAGGQRVVGNVSGVGVQSEIVVPGTARDSRFANTGKADVGYGRIRELSPEEEYGRLSRYGSEEEYGRDGDYGRDGKDGRDGKQGRDGKHGREGVYAGGDIRERRDYEGRSSFGSGRRASRSPSKERHERGRDHTDKSRSKEQNFGGKKDEHRKHGRDEPKYDSRSKDHSRYRSRSRHGDDDRRERGRHSDKKHRERRDRSRSRSRSPDRESSDRHHSGRKSDRYHDRTDNRRRSDRRESRRDNEDRDKQDDLNHLINRDLNSEGKTVLQLRNEAKARMNQEAVNHSSERAVDALSTSGTKSTMKEGIRQAELSIRTRDQGVIQDTAAPSAPASTNVPQPTPTSVPVNHSTLAAPLVTLPALPPRPVQRPRAASAPAHPKDLDTVLRKVGGADIPKANHSEVAPLPQPPSQVSKDATAAKLPEETNSKSSAQLPSGEPANTASVATGKKLISFTIPNKAALSAKKGSKVHNGLNVTQANDTPRPAPSAPPAPVPKSNGRVGMNVTTKDATVEKHGSTIRKGPFTLGGSSPPPEAPPQPAASTFRDTSDDLNIIQWDQPQKSTRRHKDVDSETEMTSDESSGDESSGEETGRSKKAQRVIEIDDSSDEESGSDSEEEEERPRSDGRRESGGRTVVMSDKWGSYNVLEKDVRPENAPGCMAPPRRRKKKVVEPTNPPEGTSNPHPTPNRNKVVAIPNTVVILGASNTTPAANRETTPRTTPAANRENIPRTTSAASRETTPLTTSVFNREATFFESNPRLASAFKEIFQTTPLKPFRRAEREHIEILMPDDQLDQNFDPLPAELGDKMHLKVTWVRIQYLELMNGNPNFHDFDESSAQYKRMLSRGLTGQNLILSPTMGPDKIRFEIDKLACFRVKAQEIMQKYVISYRRKSDGYITRIEKDGTFEDIKEVMKNAYGGEAHLYIVPLDHYMSWKYIRTLPRYRYCKEDLNAEGQLKVDLALIYWRGFRKEDQMWEEAIARFNAGPMVHK